MYLRRFVIEFELRFDIATMYKMLPTDAEQRTSTKYVRASLRRANDAERIDLAQPKTSQ